MRDFLGGFYTGFILVWIFFSCVVLKLQSAHERELLYNRQNIFCQTKGGRLLETKEGYVCVRDGDIFIQGLK